MMMLINQTIDKLNSLNLHGMANGLNQQMAQTTSQSLSFEDRLGMLVDAESSYRDTKRMKRLLVSARLAIPSATLEAIDYDPKRKLDRTLISTLSHGHWVTSRQPIIIEGASGAGKTWLACAFANQMCRFGIPSRFYKMSRLLEDIHIAKGDGSIRRLRNQIRKFHVLVLDDWLLAPLDLHAGRDLLQIIDECYEGDRTTFILTSQHPKADWHARISEPTVADAILDRITHGGHVITLSGESMRKKRARKSE